MWGLGGTVQMWPAENCSKRGVNVGGRINMSGRKGGSSPIESWAEECKCMMEGKAVCSVHMHS
jgi:hypothetical protein